MKKQIQVVMLSTNNFSVIGKYIDTGNLVINEKDKDIPRGVFMHLYFLSDDEIIENDWVYNENGKPVVQQVKGKISKDIRNYGWKKIIFSTNETLGEWIHGEYSSSKKIPPKRSKKFINYFVEQYNKGKIIEYINIECEMKVKPDDILELINQKVFPEDSSNCVFIERSIKIYPDNTIII
jgi:hypothetical protein